MHSSSPLIQPKEKGKKYNEEAFNARLAQDAARFYPLEHQYTLKSHFLEVAKFLFSQHGKYIDSIRVAERYINVLQTSAKNLLNQHRFEPKEFESIFIQKACRLLAKYARPDLNTILSIAEFNTCLWLSRSGLNIEDGLALVVRGQREIDLEEWQKDKATCIEKINEIKKYLQVRPIIENIVLNQLNRITNSRYSFLMSKADTDNKVNALVAALQKIQEVDNLDELCEFVNTYLINNPDIYCARNKLKFIFTEEDKQSSQTKVSLITIINQFGLQDRIEDRQDSMDDIELVDSKRRQTI